MENVSEFEVFLEDTQKNVGALEEERNHNQGRYKNIQLSF
jgi:hypothetical protein